MAPRRSIVVVEDVVVVVEADDKIVMKTVYGTELPLWSYTTGVRLCVLSANPEMDTEMEKPFHGPDMRTDPSHTTTLPGGPHSL